MWAKIKCTVHVTLPKRRINQFKPVQQSRQQVLRAYFSNIYTVSRAVGVSGRDWHDQGQVLCHPIAKIVIVQENCKMLGILLS